MSGTGSNAPPIFTDTAKFNIIAPTTLTPPTIILTSPTAADTDAETTTAIAPIMNTETPWELTTPTLAEWKVRNAWALGLLIYNTTNPVGLGINIHGSAANAWKSYKETYKVTSKVALINAEHDLHNTIYHDSQNFEEFISSLRTKWSNTTALGAKINNRSFQAIILQALLPS